MEPEFRITICIMAVPERLGYVHEYLVPRLAPSGYKVALFTDNQYRGCWWNCKRIYEYEPHPLHIKVIISDDLLIHPFFLHHLDVLLKYSKMGAANCISLFAPPRKFMTEAAANGYTFVRSWKLVWPPCLIVNHTWTSGLLESVKGMNAKEAVSKHDDTKMQYHAHSTGDAPLIGLLSLVQHDTSVRSANGNPAKVGKLERVTNLFREGELDFYEKISIVEEGTRAKNPPYGK